MPEGQPWQEPEDAWQAGGRVDLHTAIDTAGRSGDRRADFDSVYGDWEAVREQARRTGAPERLDADVLAALRRGRARPGRPQ